MVKKNERNTKARAHDAEFAEKSIISRVSKEVISPYF